MVGQALDSVKSIQVYRRHITELLAKAAQIKGTTDIEPELTEDDLGDDIRRLNMAVMEECPGIDERQRFDSVDLVFRQLFYDLVVRLASCWFQSNSSSSQWMKLISRPYAFRPGYPFTIPKPCRFGTYSMLCRYSGISVCAN